MYAAAAPPPPNNLYGIKIGSQKHQNPKKANTKSFYLGRK